MVAEIITIGDEILIGQIIDTNSAWIAEKLELSGIKVKQIVSISDEKEHIFEALDNARKKVKLVVMTGGLGPTSDDITKETLAEYFNTKLVVNKDVLSDVEEFIKSKGLRPNNENLKQAEVPEDCKIIRNTNGTAAGMWFERNDVIFVSMPAVPFEMKEMMQKGVLPLLKKNFKTKTITHRTVQTFGLSESSLAEELAGWESQLPSKISLAYLPSPERIRLRLSCVGENREISENNIDNEINKLNNIIGKAIFGYGDIFLEEAVGKILKDNKKTLSTAESCSGGNIARLITSISGSSEYFKGSVVAYSNEIKNKILGVKNQTLIKHGAVSKEVVEQMASGLLELFDTDYVITVSGIAGPNGATGDKPVGTTWIAVGDRNKIIARKFIFGTRRAINIRRASSKALDMLRKYISGYY